MDEPAEQGESVAPDGGDGPEAQAPSDLGHNLLAVGLGAIALTREKAESIIDDLARRGSAGTDSEAEMSPESPRVGNPGLTDRAASALRGLFQELGLVTEPTIDELELRVAQLEHRLRILERKAAQADKPQPPDKRA